MGKLESIKEDVSAVKKGKEVPAGDIGDNGKEAEEREKLAAKKHEEEERRRTLERQRREQEERVAQEAHPTPEEQLEAKLSAAQASAGESHEETPDTAAVAQKGREEKALETAEATGAIVKEKGDGHAEA